jgi:hypothetical protein
MSTTYRVTLIHLSADASTLAPATDRVELGQISQEEIVRLAGRMANIDISASPKTEPGIVVHRGERSYRIAVHQGRLRMHKSNSLYDDYWTADSAADLGLLPPFQGGTSSSTRSPLRPRGGGKKSSPLRSVAEVVGLFAIAVVLVAVGLRFGFPQKRLSDVPEDVTIVTVPEERDAVFASVAGSYSTGRTAGNSLVIIRPDGQVLLSTIGKDGKASAPRIQEQARAGRRGSIACVITSFGIIAGISPPDAVNVGRFQYKKAPATVQ